MVPASTRSRTVSLRAFYLSLLTILLPLVASTHPQPYLRRIPNTRFLEGEMVDGNFGNGTAYVETKYGPILGNDYGTYRNFQGIPFATPPLGKLRWRNPIPPGNWTDILDCRSFTIGCAQTGHTLDVPTNVSEDCLYLELWAPPVGKYSEPAAVMVFFYGGDFHEGGESFGIYNGRAMASTSNTILVVTDYRLGAFGFLYTTHLDPNVGIQDQRATLRWVSENIAAFGGNPNLVTIFGQSAGGESVMIHLTDPFDPTAKLFHRAIVESGPLSLNFREKDAALVMGELFAYHLGCTFEDLECMANATTEEVEIAASKTIGPIFSFSEAVMDWSPVVDQKTFRIEPALGFQKGVLVKVPLMMGSNVDDGLLFSWAISNDGYLNAELYVAIVTGIFLGSHEETIFEYYPPNWEGNNQETLERLFTDYIFACDTRRALRWAEQAGMTELYLYQFGQVPPCFWPKSQIYCCNRTCHGDELPYVFYDSGNPFPWTLNGTDVTVAEAVSSYWISFAHTGSPNQMKTPSAPTWPTYSAKTDLNMKLQYPIKTETGLKSKVCDMWDEVGYYHKRAVIEKFAKRFL